LVVLEKEINTAHLNRISEDLSSLEYALSGDQLIKAAGNLGDSFKRYHTAKEEAGGEAALKPIKDGFELILGSKFDAESKKLAIEALASPILSIRGQRLSEDGVIELFRILAECNECLSLNNSYTPLIVTKLTSHVDISPEGIEKLAEITASVKDSQLKSDMIEVLGNRIGDDRQKHEAARKHLPNEIDDLFKRQNRYALEFALAKTEVSQFPRSLYRLLEYLDNNRPEDSDDTLVAMELQDHVLGDSSTKINLDSDRYFLDNCFPSNPLCYFRNIRGVGARFYIIDRVEFSPVADPIPENASYPIIFTNGAGTQCLDYSLYTYYSFEPKPLELNVPVQSILCRDITDHVNEGLKSENIAEKNFYNKLRLAAVEQDEGIIQVSLDS